MFCFGQAKFVIIRVIRPARYGACARRSRVIQSSYPDRLRLPECHHQHQREKEAERLQYHQIEAGNCMFVERSLLVVIIWALLSGCAKPYAHDLFHGRWYVSSCAAGAAGWVCDKLSALAVLLKPPTRLRHLPR